MLSLCLLSACSPRIFHQPSARSEDQGDPARDAQAHLLKEAYRAFVQERYPAAALFFNRFIVDSSDSPRLAEARWWLGRSYEQLGDYPAAMAQYRAVASGQLVKQLNGALYEGQAMRRLDQLRPLHARSYHGSAKQVALRVTMGELPDRPVLTAWFNELIQSGVTVLVLDPIETSASDTTRFNFETISDIVSEAHRTGLVIWLVLDIHQGVGMDVNQEWAARTIDSLTQGQGQGDGSGARLKPDIANPSYQSYLEQLMQDIAQSGCDGIVIPARSATGFAKEFSPDSVRLFVASFGLSLSPEELLTGRQLSDTQLQEQEKSSTYWRWVGWKSRSYARLVARLRKLYRERSPTATVLVEVHQGAVTTPLQELEQYGEDLLDLMPRTGGSVVVRQEETGSDLLLEKLAQQPGFNDRVWIGISSKMTGRTPSLERLKQVVTELTGSGRWNILVTGESAHPVP
jgi:Tetratricopeptide repeat